LLKVPTVTRRFGERLLTGWQRSGTSIRLRDGELPIGLTVLRATPIAVQGITVLRGFSREPSLPVPQLTPQSGKSGKDSTAGCGIFGAVPAIPDRAAIYADLLGTHERRNNHEAQGFHKS